MTKIDVVSGFLGAGKTTLIKKLLMDCLAGTKTVLVENEFGEIGVDGGFLQDAGIEIKEMNSGCICCSLVGDFEKSLKEVIDTYKPERIIIEPSGVGKLSDVLVAINNAAGNLSVEVNSAVTMVDASKAKVYAKNFGEFFKNQIQYAGTVILSRVDKIDDEKMQAVVELIKEINPEATVITTALSELEGSVILATIEGRDKLDDFLSGVLAEAIKEHEEHEHEHHHHHHHDDDDEECCCGHHHHDDDDEDEHEHHHHHHHDDDDEDEHEHHHHHHHDDDDEECCCGHHHHDDDDDDDEDEHEHHHHHEHHYDENGVCSCGHHHHHDADEIFTSFGKETARKYTKEEIENILSALDSGKYGSILRAKGMVQGKDGEWIFFDYVPEETSVRTGSACVTGKICVIGAELKEHEIEELFNL